MLRWRRGVWTSDFGQGGAEGWEQLRRAFLQEEGGLGKLTCPAACLGQGGRE